MRPLRLPHFHIHLPFRTHVIPYTWSDRITLYRDLYHRPVLSRGLCLTPRPLLIAMSSLSTHCLRYQMTFRTNHGRPCPCITNPCVPSVTIAQPARDASRFLGISLGSALKLKFRPSLRLTSNSLCRLSHHVSVSNA